MFPRFFQRFCFLLLLAVCFSAAGSCRVDAAQKWDIFDIGGVSYVKLDDVWRFYKFGKMAGGHQGCVSYGAANRVVSVRPSRQDFYVNNFRYILSYPVREYNGKLMISTTDMKKLVDPVLRPRFSPSNAKISTVIIDPGHGGHDAGAVSSYAREKDCNLAVGLKLRDKLQKRGFKVVMTRDSDFFLTLQQRVAIANQYPNSLFVSIHHNSGGRDANGIETFTLAPQGTTSPFARTRRNEELEGNNQDSENIALATAVHSRAITRTKAFDRGIQRARFSVLCTIKRPAILFEGGFVSNATEGSKISTDAYRELLANCICDGIVSYCQVARGKSLRTKSSSSSVRPSSALKTRSSGSVVPGS